MVIDQYTPIKELIFTINHATVNIIEATQGRTKLSELDTVALLADISEAQRELTLREGQ